MNLQQFCKQCPDPPQLGEDISATGLSCPIHRRGKVQSPLWTLQRLIYSRREWIQLCTSFYKNRRHIWPKKHQASVKLSYRFFAYLQKESEEFSLLFPCVKCPFIVLHACFCFATCFSASRVHNLYHLCPLLFWIIASLPVGELLSTRLSTTAKCFLCWVCNDTKSYCKWEVNTDTQKYGACFCVKN